MIPTSDQVAKIIIVACGERSVSPLLFDAAVPKDADAGDAIRQARAYSAMALRRLFPKCPSDSIGRMVGAINPEAYLGQIISLERKGRLRWFDPAAVDRIVNMFKLPGAAPASALAPKKAAAPPVKSRPVNTAFRRPPPRHAVDRFSKRRDAMDELQRAVLNTGGRIDDEDQSSPGV